MLAMQYRFVLPADYDMGIVDQRVATRGHMTDGFPGLLFKAYLIARKSDGRPDNEYAPFYVWKSVEGMNAFLTGGGFAGVSQAFGWPSVKQWIVWEAEPCTDPDGAHFATEEIVPINAHASLAPLRESETARARDEFQGAVAWAIGFEPTSWTLLRFALWRRQPAEREGRRLYAVEHVSTSN